MSSSWGMTNGNILWNNITDYLWLKGITIIIYFISLSIVNCLVLWLVSYDVLNYIDFSIMYASWLALGETRRKSETMGIPGLSNCHLPNIPDNPTGHTDGLGKWTENSYFGLLILNYLHKKNYILLLLMVCQAFTMHKFLANYSLTCCMTNNKTKHHRQNHPYWRVPHVGEWINVGQKRTGSRIECDIKFTEIWLVRASSTIRGCHWSMKKRQIFLLQHVALV